MFKSNNNKLYYVLKKIKYDLKSIFVERNKQVAIFQALNLIGYEEKIDVEINEIGFVYPPKLIDEKQTKHEVKFNNIIVYKIKNARIFPNANAVFLNYKHTLYYEKWHDDNNLNICDYSSKNIYTHNANGVRFNHKISDDKIDNAIFLGCTFPDNYYHFLLELISRVQYLKIVPNYKQYPIIIDDKILEYNSLKTIVEIFLKDYNILYLNNEYLYKIKDLWYITSPNTMLPNLRKHNKFVPEHTKIRPSSIQYLKENILTHYKDTLQIDKEYSRIFIKRKSLIRSFNQDEIEKSVLKYHFKTVYFEDLSFLEQISILQSADYIVGATGAAWTNLIFAKENAKGLIWMGDNWGQVSMFSTIAKIVNFDLNYFIYNSKSSNYHENFEIDLNIFEENLNKLMLKND